MTDLIFFIGFIVFVLTFFVVASKRYSNDKIDKIINKLESDEYYTCETKKLISLYIEDKIFGFAYSILLILFTILLSLGIYDYVNRFEYSTYIKTNYILDDNKVLIKKEKQCIKMKYLSDICKTINIKAIPVNELLK